MGLLGPNGAGKTSTVRMLTTLTKPSGGSATVGGFDVVRQAGKVRELVGIVPQDLSVDDDLTGTENLILQSRLYRVPREEARKRAQALLRLVNLDDAANRDVETYSGGMRKRLEIICGLIGNPRILFLDEPTLGLDVQSRFEIWKYLRNINREGSVTLFLTTHYMGEAESLCDEVVILNRGKLVVAGSPATLKAGMSGRLFELTVRTNGKPVVDILNSAEYTANLERIGEDSYRAELTCDELALQKLISRLESAGGVILSITPTEPTLEKVFLHYTGARLRQDVEGEDTMAKYLRKRRDRIGQN